MATILCLYLMMQLSSAAQLGMPITNQNHQVIFSNIGHFATNVNFHHVRIPVNLTTIIDTPKAPLQKIKAQNRDVYTTTIADLKKTVGFNQSDSLSEAIAQQSFNTAYKDNYYQSLQHFLQLQLADKNNNLV